MRLPAILVCLAAFTHAATGPVTVTVSPAMASIRAGAEKQFSATVANSPTQTVTWTATIGTISASGKHQAPATVPAPNTATITAKASDGHTIGTATITLLNPQPAISNVTPSSV